MRLLVACEESQEVTTAFRNLGYEAYSCDIVPTAGQHPEWHIQGDVLPLLEQHWDLVIGFPPCTYLSNAGARHLYKGGKLNQERYEKGMLGKDFFMQIYNYPGRVAVENPVPSRVFGMPLYSQIIQPWEHGDPWTKRTCLWLKDLPLLEPTNIVEPQGTWCVSGTYRKTKDKSKIGAHTTDRARQRAKTFPGIAKAMGSLR